MFGCVVFGFDNEFWGLFWGLNKKKEVGEWISPMSLFVSSAPGFGPGFNSRINKYQMRRSEMRHEYYDRSREAERVILSF